jgi:anti-sigma B factor antagonist
MEFFVILHSQKFKNMDYTTEKHEKYIVLKLKDDKLNDLISSQLKVRFEELHNDGERNIILDLTRVNYCDSSGLSAILMGNKLCKNAFGSFVLCGLNVNVQRVITISQLDKVLLICPSLQEAIDLVFMDEIERELLNTNAGE